MGTIRSILFAMIDPPPQPRDYYRDSVGALKREAARFRIYGYNAAGLVVRELISENADINWSVHVANRKAQWYQFQAALDIPDALQDQSLGWLGHCLGLSGCEVVRTSWQHHWRVCIRWSRAPF
jgi:hypothetical protein